MGTSDMFFEKIKLQKSLRDFVIKLSKIVHLIMLDGCCPFKIYKFLHCVWGVSKCCCDAVISVFLRSEVERLVDFLIWFGCIHVPL